MRNLKTHSAEKLKGGTLWDFLVPILLLNRQKIEERLFRDDISK